MIGRQISATDRRMDRLVYELYGLSKEEIRIVRRRRPDDELVDPVYVIADIVGTEHLEGFEITLYFEDRVLGDPVRARLVAYIPRMVTTSSSSAGW